MIKINEVKYGIWGRCIKLEDGKNELIATLDFGPRIIKFAEVGCENILFEDTNLSINKKGKEDDYSKTFGEDKGVWYIRGGHRLWVSPEEYPRTYYPDNQPVKYEKIENGVRLTPPKQQGNNFQLEIDITMPEENCVHIVHKVTNIGLWPVECAPWAITVLSPGGTEIIPMPTRDTGLLENRNIILWSYTKMNDKRVNWGEKYITLKQEAVCDGAFKIGQLSQHGWAAYFNHGDVFVKYFDTKEDESHPDRNCNFETYTARKMLEMESIGVMKTINPGETISHSECWSFYKGVKVPENEAQMDEFAKKYVED